MGPEQSGNEIIVHFRRSRSGPHLGRQCGLSVALLFTLLGPGCGALDAGREYQETADLIAARTGVAGGYQPGMDAAAIHEAVEGLLEDGVTADEAVRIALLNNPGLQALFFTVGVSRADLVQAWLPANPSVALSVRAPQGGGRPNVTTSVLQSVADLLLLPVKVAIAKGHLEESRLRVARGAVELAARVQRTFYALLAARRARQLAEENVSLGVRTLAAAQARFEAGEVDALDLNLARADLLELKRQSLLQERDLGRAQARLAALLGLSRWADSWQVAGEYPAPVPLASDAALLQQALSERLDLRIAGRGVEVAEQELRRQHFAIIPYAAVGFERERAEAPPNLRGPTLSFTLPIWDQNEAQVARAERVLDGLRRQYEGRLDGAAQDVRQAAVAARSAGAQITLFTAEVLPRARENVAAAERAYRSGRHDILRLMEAQRALIAARLRSNTARREYAGALADLRLAVGGNLPPAAAPPGDRS